MRGRCGEDNSNWGGELAKKKGKLGGPISRGQKKGIGGGRYSPGIHGRVEGKTMIGGRSQKFVTILRNFGKEIRRTLSFDWGVKRGELGAKKGMRLGALQTEGGSKGVESFTFHVSPLRQSRKGKIFWGGVGGTLGVILPR